ncbi:lipoprotein [Pseudogulbenkiania sp. MAI-1]|uniref:COG4315 family predicted lipoprotein n=1 Tax=Pseudogulbenkiania sp. MAI-1 TaxID=990370 RepID=UPI00045E8482|nr:lipoprotein [Pseudogulbenkiania sp. MAI-1]
MKRWNLAASSLVFLMTGMAWAGDAPVTKTQGVLTDTRGMTLYTFDKDVAGSGKSACNGECPAIWPPLRADSGAIPTGELSVITRDDGSKQWAYKGKPLYYFAKDQAAGDTLGDNVKNVWHLVRE